MFLYNFIFLILFVFVCFLQRSFILIVSRTNQVLRLTARLLTELGRERSRKYQTANSNTYARDLSPACLWTENLVSNLKITIDIPNSSDFCGRYTLWKHYLGNEFHIQIDFNPIWVGHQSDIMNRCEYSTRPNRKVQGK